MQLVSQEGPSERLLHRSLALVGLLPLGEPHLLDDAVDVVDDPLDDDWGALVACALEEFSERCLAEVLLDLGHYLALDLDRLAGELGELLQVVEAKKDALFVTLANLLQPFAQLDEAAVGGMLLDALDELDLQLLGLLLVVPLRDEVFEDVTVHHERLKIVADYLDMHVLVDELDSLCAQSVPEEFALASWWMHGLVDLCEPDVVGAIRRERGIRGKRLPMSRKVGVRSGELVADVVVREAFLGGE